MHIKLPSIERSSFYEFVIQSYIYNIKLVLFFSFTQKKIKHIFGKLLTTDV